MAKAVVLLVSVLSVLSFWELLASASDIELEG